MMPPVRRIPRLTRRIAHADVRLREPPPDVGRLTATIGTERRRFSRSARRQSALLRQPSPAAYPPDSINASTLSLYPRLVLRGVPAVMMSR